MQNQIIIPKRSEIQIIQKKILQLIGLKERKYEFDEKKRIWIKKEELFIPRSIIKFSTSNNENGIIFSPNKIINKSNIFENQNLIIEGF